MKLFFTLIVSVCLFPNWIFANTFTTEVISGHAKSDFQCEIAGELLVHHVSCKGVDDGILILNMTGGTLPYTYAWSNGDDQDVLIELPPGDYSVTITDAADCTLEFSATITEPDFLFANASTFNESAPGANDGSAFANPTGGTPPYTYLWDNNSTSPTISNLAVGDYTITVTDDNECISIQTVTVNAFGCSVTVANTVTQISCFGECDGQTGVMFGGGTGPYSFLWSTGSQASNLSGLCEGLYTVTVTDGNGCSEQNTIEITEPDLLTLELENVVNIGCFGTNSGSISVQAYGGTAPYEYLWSNGDTENTIDSLAIGTYTVSLTDNGDCTLVMDVEISQAPLLEIFIENINPTDCSGTATGSATSTATGGTGNYTFNWSNGAVGPSVDNLAAGVYTVTVTDASNCIAEDTLIISEPALLELEVAETNNLTCFEASDGAASVTATGGTGAYVYSWPNAASGNAVDGLAASTYSVSVTDANNCVTEVSVEITQPEVLEITVTETSNVSCYEAADGAINITATGGTEDYVYSWSNGAASSTAEGLSPGNYTVTVTDANSCTAEMSVEISQPELLEMAVIEMNNITCFGEASGSVSLIATGGTPEYIYSWSNGTSGNIVDGLTAGNYAVTVTDTNNCTEEFSFEITEPVELSLNLLQINDISCFGANDGSVSIEPSGGMPPYSLDWSNGATGTNLNGLAEGNYIVTMSDTNNCTAEMAIQITEPAVLELNVESITNNDCSGPDQGAVTVLAAGGTGDYLYEWSNGATGNQLSDLSSGIYIVTVSDENNCLESIDIEILSGLDDEAPVVLIQDINLFLDVDGTVSLTPEEVDNGSFDNCGIVSMELSNTEFDCDHLGSNTLLFVVTDLAGNSSEQEVTVVVTDTIVPQIICPDNITTVGCGANVAYELPAVTDNCSVNGQPVLESGFLSGETFPVGSTTVSYSFTDAGSNTTTCSFEVEVFAVLIVDYFVQHISCNGAEDGAISISVNNGTPDYEYNWEAGFSEAEVQGLAAGIYNLTVTDGEGCAITLSIDVLEPNPLGIEVELVVDETNGESNGSIDITPTGGVGPFTFEWYLNDVLFSELGDLTGLAAGDYILVMTDANGCIFTSEVIAVDKITGVYDPEENVGFRLAPNPTSSVVYINIEEKLTGNVFLSVLDVLGQKVMKKRLIEPGTNEWQLDFSNYNNGTYFVRLDCDQGRFVSKVVVSR